MIADVDLLAVGQFRLQLLGENSGCSKAADQLDARLAALTGATLVGEDCASACFPFAGGA
jgi:hypothetical protein